MHGNAAYPLSVPCWTLTVMLTWLGSRRAPKSEVDPYDLNAPRFAAFLDQARWLLAEQQRRGASFQQAAVALVGFDGVLLALLIGNDTLRDVDRYSLPWWAAILGALFFVGSAIVGLRALRPTPIYSSKVEATVKAWQTFITEGSEKEDVYHFAHMLLVTDPPTEGLKSDPLRWEYLRRALGRPSPPTQPLIAAEQLATHRGTLAMRASRLLVGGILALFAFLLSVPPADTQPISPQGGQPSATSSTTPQPLEQP